MLDPSSSPVGEGGSNNQSNSPAATTTTSAPNAAPAANPSLSGMSPCRSVTFQKNASKTIIETAIAATSRMKSSMPESVTNRQFK